MTKEKRASIRAAVNFQVRWDGSSGMHESRIEDIGVGGCFVNTKGMVKLGDPVVLQIKLPTGRWIPLRGRITSYQPGIGFGVVFCPLNQAEKNVFGMMFV
jgi:Tfp pilus assembly protein PilZ